MKVLSSLSLFFSLSIFSAFGQTTYVKTTNEENKAVGLVARLPEVIDADNYVRKASKGKRHLVSFLASHPTKDVPYYWVKVVEDNGGAFHAHFHFYVEPKSYKIFYLDIVTDKIIPEKQCRKKLMADYSVK